MSVLLLVSARYINLEITKSTGCDKMRTIKRLFSYTTIFASVIALYGCSGGTGNSALISEFAFHDNGVKSCILSAAEENGWESIEDITAIHCELTGRDRERALAMDDSDGSMPGIFNTSDFASFTQLKDLILRGHLYTELDVSALAQLESLDVRSSFLRALDLSHNTKLKHLDVGSTAISKVDLSGLPRLESLNATSHNRVSGVYQRVVLDGNEEVFGTSIDEIMQTPTDIIFHDSASLVSITVDKDFQVTIPDTQKLKELQGAVNVDVLMSAPTLNRIAVTLTNTDDNLDFGDFNQLESLTLAAQDIVTLTLSESVKTVDVTANFQQLIIPEGALLEELKLKAVSETSQTTDMSFQEFIANAPNLRVLLLEDFFLGRVLDLTQSSNLVTLVMDNAEVDILLQLPASLKNLTLIDFTLGATISPNELGIEKLVFSNVYPENCGLDNNSYPSLRSLAIWRCDIATLNLENSPDIKQLMIRAAPISSIDLNSIQSIDRLGLIETNISFIDFSVLDDDVSRSGFIFSSSIASQDQLETLSNDANNHFSLVTVTGN